MCPGSGAWAEAGCRAQGWGGDPLGAKPGPAWSGGRLGGGARGGGAWPASGVMAQVGSGSGARPGRVSLPERGGRAAEVQGRQALGAEQVGVRPVLQQQLGAGRVAPQAGLVQGSLAAGAGVGVRATAEQVAHAGGVATGRGDAQGRGELALVLQGPEAWGRGEVK